MRSVKLILLLICTLSAFAIYNVGDTVDEADNLNWTVEGPSSHPDMGVSDKLFDMIRRDRKPVMLFFGGTG